MIPEQRPIEQPNLASAPEPQFGMPWNNYAPYINPYQSFPNPMSVQVDSKIQVHFQRLHLEFKQPNVHMVSKTQMCYSPGI